MKFYILVSYPEPNDRSQQRPYCCIGEIQAESYPEAWYQIFKMITDEVPDIDPVNRETSQPFTTLKLNNGVYFKLDGEPKQGLEHWVKQASLFT